VTLVVHDRCDLSQWLFDPGEPPLPVWRRPRMAGFKSEVPRRSPLGSPRRGRCARRALKEPPLQAGRDLPQRQKADRLAHRNGVCVEQIVPTQLPSSSPNAGPMRWGVATPVCLCRAHVARVLARRRRRAAAWMRRWPRAGSVGAAFRWRQPNVSVSVLLGEFGGGGGIGGRGVRAPISLGNELAEDLA